MAPLCRLPLPGRGMFVGAIVADDRLDGADGEDRALLAADGNGNWTESHECLHEARTGSFCARVGSLSVVLDECRGGRGTGSARRLLRDVE